MDISVSLGDRSYRILVGPGMLDAVGPELSRAGVGRRVLLVTAPAIKAVCGARVGESLATAGFEVFELLVPDGESAKTLEVAGRGWDASLASGLDRTSTVVALGGGTVGDLAGFVAATYMRGINLVQVPTTLLAQVDAASGGKTAINHPRARNLIGAFHQPRFVIVDTDVLMTLPDREYRSGLAEIIKHGIVLDAAYFADLESGWPALMKRERETLTRVVAGSCRIKAGVIERDEQEAELRAVLNYGHTVGHALEAITAYRRWTHGEAVSLGIVAAARLAERLGIASAECARRQVRLLEAVGLPIHCGGVAATEVLEVLGRDKKSRDGRVPFVLAPEIGSFRLIFDIPRAAILDAVEAITAGDRGSGASPAR